MGSSLPPSPVITGRNNKLLVKNSRIVLPSRLLFRQVMASPPTISTAQSTALTAPHTWYAATGQSSSWTPPAGGSIAASEFFTYTKCGSVTAGTSYPGYVSVAAKNITLTNTPTYGANSFGVLFMHDGSELEILTYGNGGYFFLKIDDQYVSLSAPTLIPTNNVINYHKVTFSSRWIKKVEIIGYGVNFVGINADTNDSIQPAPYSGPLAIVMGDSFVDGTGSSYSTCTNWVQWMSDYLGWNNMWSAGLGGTGYIATDGGTRYTLGQRLQHDALQYNPDVLMCLEGVNDGSFAPAAVQAAALSFWQAARQALPNALLIQIINNNVGMCKTSSNYLNNKAALIAAVTDPSVNGMVLDILELPFPAGYTPISSALTSAIAAFAVSFASPVPFPVGATVQIGVPGSANVERVEVASCTGGPTSYSVGFLGGRTIQNAHAIGEPILQVGGSLWTGAGRTNQVNAAVTITAAGSGGTPGTYSMIFSGGDGYASQLVGTFTVGTGGTVTAASITGQSNAFFNTLPVISTANAPGLTGAVLTPSLTANGVAYGNCSRIVSEDSTHPVDPGHQAIGHLSATLLMQALTPN
jgi:hypothetical protein